MERSPSPVDAVTVVYEAKTRCRCHRESGVNRTVTPNCFCSRAYFTAILRGLFQYGLLHFGQTFGSPLVLLRGSHSCSQREQR